MTAVRTLLVVDPPESVAADLDARAVALADEPPTRGYVEGFVTPGPDPVDRLLWEVDRAITGETRIQLADARERATRLHEVISDLVGADTEAELFDAAVGIAERVLLFDRAAFLRRTDGGFVTVAATDAAERDPAGGAVGRALDERRTVLVAATAAAFARVDRRAALLLVPYLAWVAFVGVLNYRFWTLN